MARRRNRFKFTGKSHSQKGIIVTAGASVLIALFVVFLFVAFKTAGNLSVYYGAWGVVALTLAVILLILSIQSLFEEDSFPLFPRVGLVLDLIAIFGWGGVYALGLGLF